MLSLPSQVLLQSVIFYLVKTSIAGKADLENFSQFLSAVRELFLTFFQSLFIYCFSLLQIKKGSEGLVGAGLVHPLIYFNARALRYHLLRGKIESIYHAANK